MSEIDDAPPELRQAPPAAPPASGATPPKTLTLEEVNKMLEEEKKAREAAEAATEIYRTRASEMEDTARGKEAALAQAKSEIGQKDDIIQGLHRGAETQWGGSVRLANTAWTVNHNFDGFVAFLKGPTRNWWPLIIFGVMAIFGIVIVVELPYISQSPIDMAVAVLIVAILALVGYWQSRS